MRIVSAFGVRVEGFRLDAGKQTSIHIGAASGCNTSRIVLTIILIKELEIRLTRDTHRDAK